MTRKKNRFSRTFRWHPLLFGGILAGCFCALAGCDGGCDRPIDPVLPDFQAALTAAERLPEAIPGAGDSVPETWQVQAPVRQRLTLRERNRERSVKSSGERTATAVRQAAETAVRAVLLFPQEAVFAAPGLPGTKVDFPEPGVASVQGWLIAPDEQGSERRMQYRVRIRFERGIFIRAELPEIAVEPMGKM